MNFRNLFDCFVFDMDGVLYSGQTPIANSPQVLKVLRQIGKTICFFTNNPSLSPLDYTKKLKKLNIESSTQEFITSPMATVSLVKEKMSSKKWKTVFVAGSDYLKEEMRKTKLCELEGKSAYETDLVVLGSHPRFSFEEIRTASIAVGNGAYFVGTNSDLFYPCEHGRAPATGSLLAAVEAASGKKAITAGKPKKYMFDLIGKRWKGPKKKVLVIGDSFATDITGAKKAGYSTALVLTGVTREKDLRNAVAPPDYVLKNISFLFESMDQ